MQQPASGVVDVNEQGASVATILKPSMVRAVDLHKLAKAVASTAGLMKLLSTLGA